MKGRTTPLIAAAALIAASAATLASCERETATRTENPTFDGDRAYCVVKINDVNTSSTRATDGGFENGSANEYAVNDAHFYFYDSYGELVVETSAQNPSGSVPDPANENIDWGSSTVITLEGLSSKNYPSYVVTVINRPDGFSAPNELADFEGLLADASGTGIGESGSFTMSTSSYLNGEDYYFATPVAEENFSTEPLDGDSDSGYTDRDGNDIVPIDIYVERLTAKVRLAMDATVTGTEVDGETLYPITVEMIDETEGTAAETTLYVRINGWGLNGTAKYSNMVKTIDPEWTFTWGGGTDGWSDPGNFRTYWGESFNYGIVPASGYPTTATDGTDDGNGNYYDGTTYSEYLEYHSYNDLESQIGDEMYCGENTNTAGDPTEGVAYVITNPQSSAITNILVSATVCDEDGNPLSLVRHDGVLYTTDDFLAYAMGHNTALYVLDEDGSLTVDGDAYELCGPDYVELVNEYDGHVSVHFMAEYENTTFYYITGNATDGYTVEEYTYDDAEEYLDERFNNLYSEDANAYTGGDMYYNIPIQHLNDDYSGTYIDGDGEEQTLVLEGNYGVVRNHIYAVTITGVENLGRGVFDPDEIIIPQIDEDTYTLLAQINILSWKVVEQGVVL